MGNPDQATAAGSHPTGCHCGRVSGLFAGWEPCWRCYVLLCQAGRGCGVQGFTSHALGYQHTHEACRQGSKIEQNVKEAVDGNVITTISIVVILKYTMFYDK